MRDINELTEWINNNTNCIINTIEAGSINNYLFIKNNFENGNIIDNIEFQRRFKHFYRLNYARLTDEFYVNFFAKFDKLRNDEISQELSHSILMEWYNIPNRRRLNTIQFSFFSKFIHTLNNDKIIYDRLVRDFFCLENVANIYGLTPTQKIDAYVMQYDKLTVAYQNIINEGRLGNVILLFDERFPDARKISQVKKLDFIFWTSGKIMNG